MSGFKPECPSGFNRNLHIAITIHSGATPERLVDDFRQVWSAPGRLDVLAGFDTDSGLRLGFGLVGAGLCGLVLAVLSALDGDDPS